MHHSHTDIVWSVLAFATGGIPFYPEKNLRLGNYVINTFGTSCSVLLHREKHFIMLARVMNKKWFSWHVCCLFVVHLTYLEHSGEKHYYSYYYSLQYQSFWSWLVLAKSTVQGSHDSWLIVWTISDLDFGWLFRFLACLWLYACVQEFLHAFARFSFPHGFCQNDINCLNIIEVVLRT